MADMLPFKTELKDSPLLRELTESDTKILFEHMDHLCYEADQKIIEQGTDNKGLWLLGEGCCQVSRFNNRGTKQQLLAMLGPGTVFGEMSFFLKTAHSATISSVSQVTVHLLTQSAFGNLKSQHPMIANQVLINLIQVISERLQMMDQWVCELMDQTPAPAARQDEWHEFRAKLYTEWDFK